MSTIKLGRAGVLSEVSYQQVDITRGAIRVTGNVHVADATDMTYAVEQIAALVNNPDETFVPVIWGDYPAGWDGFYRVLDISLGSTQPDVWTLTADLERVQGFAAPLFESIVMGGKRAAVGAGVTAQAWQALPAAARTNPREPLKPLCLFFILLFLFLFSLSATQNAVFVCVRTT